MLNSDSNKTGLIFSIEEFAVFDGDGIRVNVFFKGCPLRCRWCHNPEGFEMKRQIVRSPNGCTGCGECRRVCTSPEGCRLCMKCVYACPRHLIRVSGEEWSVERLAKRVLKLKPILEASGGGVTFSGGEVLLQVDFLCEILDRLSELNRAIETSGFAESENLERVLSRVDFVYYDIKHMDSEKHRFFTGVPNEQILENAKILMASGVEHVFRVPFIHGVNSDRENLERLADFLGSSQKRERVELLLYNKMAGAKYKMLGREYGYDFEQPTPEELESAKEILKDLSVTIRK